MNGTIIASDLNMPSFGPNETFLDCSSLLPFPTVLPMTRKTKPRFAHLRTQNIHSSIQFILSIMARPFTAFPTSFSFQPPMPFHLSVCPTHLPKHCIVFPSINCFSLPADCWQIARPAMAKRKATNKKHTFAMAKTMHSFGDWVGLHCDHSANGQTMAGHGRRRINCGRQGRE